MTSEPLLTRKLKIDSVELLLCINFLTKIAEDMQAPSNQESQQSPSMAVRQFFGLAGLRERLISMKENSVSQQSSESLSPKAHGTPTMAEKAV